MSNLDEKQKMEEPELIDVMTLLTDYLRILRRMWIHVLILAIIGGLVFGFRAQMFYHPMYTASATFTINIRVEQQDGTAGNTTFFDNAAAEQMAKTFPYILTSGVLRRRVAKDMGKTAVPGVIQASVAPDTNLLTISVRDSDPERASKTLKAVVDNYPAISEGIVGKINMELLDETGIPKVPDNPRSVKRPAAKGAIAGMGLGLLWVGLVMVGRRTIRREEDCPRMVNKRCLGSVPQIRAKARSKKVTNRLNIMEKNISPEFQESFRIIRNKVEYSAHRNGLRSILVTSALAGEGKSTIATNLALSLAQDGKKVALIDCDLRHPSDSAILNKEPGKGLAEYLRGEIPIEECMLTGKSLDLKESVKFLFVPGGKAVADGTELLSGKRMYRIIKSLEKQMDYVILDSAPVGILTDAGILAQFADGAVFVIKKDFARTDYILEGMEHLAEGRIHMIGCILNGNY